jgi:hypothetical protein
VCKNIRLEILVPVGYDRKVNQVRRDFVSDQVFGKSTDQGNTLFLRFLSPVGIPLNKSQAKILGKTSRAVKLFAHFIQYMEDTFLFFIFVSKRAFFFEEIRHVLSKRTSEYLIL